MVKKLKAKNTKLTIEERRKEDAYKLAQLLLDIWREKQQKERKALLDEEKHQ